MKNKRIFLLSIPLMFIMVFLFLFYGPIESFRLMWINTAMYTSRHRFLAEMFYSDEYIAEIIARNNFNDSAITDESKLARYWDDEILFAELRGNYYRGYIVRINDPRRLVFVQSETEEGELLEYFTEIYGAQGGINASGYLDPFMRGLVSGITVLNGEFLSGEFINTSHNIGGFRDDHKFIVGSFSREDFDEASFLWALEFGPILIVNGEKNELTSFSGGLAPRTAIGQTEEGHILLVVIDGRQAGSLGATFLDLQNILFANGAVNAINLDGGSSSSMVYQGQLVNNPSDGSRERLLPNAILFR